MAQNQVVLDEKDDAAQIQTDQFSTQIKRLTLLEKEIFDLHRQQKLRQSNWRRRQNLSVEFNYELMDAETRTSIKRRRQ